MLNFRDIEIDDKEEYERYIAMDIAIRRLPLPISICGASLAAPDCHG